MLAQTTVNGLVTGGSYATFAVGFTLIFGIHRILNFAQGYVFAWGAIVALYCIRGLDVPWLLALIVALLVGGVLTVLADILVFQPLDRRHAPEAATLVASIGAGLILQNFAQQATHTDVLRFPQDATPQGVWRIGGVVVSSIQLVILVTAVVMTGALVLFLRYTQRGKRTKAVAENADTARLMGINPRSIRLTTFFIGGAFAGVAGVLIGIAFNTVNYVMGEPYLLIGMAAVTLGGMGSVVGAFAGGMILGLARAFTVAYLSSSLSEALPFLVLFLVLLVRPQGLLRTSGAITRVRAGRL